MSRLKRLRQSLTQFPDIDPPSSWLLASEARAICELWAGVAMYLPLRHLAARGDGHPVLVLPGLGATDVSTALLRKFLDDLGYASYCWEQGRNRGFQDVTHTSLLGRLSAIHGQHQRKDKKNGRKRGHGEN